VFASGAANQLLAAQQEDSLFTAAHAYEISRETMGRCRLDAGHMVNDNAQIAAYSRRVQEQIRV